MPGRFKEAAPLCARAVGMLRQVFGAGHPNMATALMLQVRPYLYQACGFESILTKAERSPRGILTCQEGCACGHATQAAVALGAGQAQEAELLVRPALDIRREALGADSGEAAASLCLLADVLLELGRQAHTSPVGLPDSLSASCQVMLGPFRRPLKASPVHDRHICTCIALLPDLARREEAAHMSLEARQYHYGAESLQAAASLQAVTAVLLATGRLAEAEAQCRRLLQIRYPLVCQLHAEALTGPSRLPCRPLTKCHAASKEALVGRS